MKLHTVFSDLVEQEVLKDHRSHGDLELPLGRQGVNLGVHQGELLTGVLVTVLHKVTLAKQVWRKKNYPTFMTTMM